MLLQVYYLNIKKILNFEFLNFMGHLPQIIDEEDDIVKY